MSETPPPDGPTYAPTHVSVQLKGFIDDEGHHSAIIFTFGMGDNPNTPQVHFVIDPAEWYPIAIESLVQIATFLPQFRPQYWVDNSWFEGPV